MGTILLAALAGWLTLAAPPPVTQQQTDKEGWVTRLVGLRDHMHTAFGVGPDLTLLDPDLGLEIVTEAWPKIKEQQVKTGLLKTFAFSKALPKKHAKVLQVLDLGMHDDDPEIRSYAASYVKEYAGKNFTDDPKGYSAWYGENRDKSPQELLAANERKSKPAASGRKTPADRKAAIAQAEELSKQGWELWNQQKMVDAAKLFEQAVKLDPSSTNAWNGLGWARFNSGDSEQAVAAFERCVELDRKHPAALNGLGQVYLMWGDLDKAEKYLLKSASYPHASAAWFGLARIYLVTGKFDNALPWLRKALSEDPENADLKQMLEAAQNKKLPETLEKQLKPAGKPENSPADQAALEGWQEFNAGNPRSAELSFNRAGEGSGKPFSNERSGLPVAQQRQSG